MNVPQFKFVCFLVIRLRHIWQEFTAFGLIKFYFLNLFMRKQ